MIVRGYLKCGECEHPHIVRIGMGQENEQRHQFNCRSCKEPIGIGLNVDYKNISTEIVYGMNAVASGPNQGSVVNLDANYLIPEDDQGKELVFPRLAQSSAMIQKIIADRRAQGLPEFPDSIEPISGMRPEFAAEWRDLRAAWSLRRNGNVELSDRRIQKTSKERYSGTPLSGIEDWLWRFVSLMSGRKYQKIFDAAIEDIKKVAIDDRYKSFVSEYTANISKNHGRIYFELLKSYFDMFDEFSQVHFLATSDADFPDASAASSAFDKVKMFYGNSFEYFSSLVDFFAYINNLLAGREYGEFSSMDRTKYLQLDKASRFRCFEDNMNFTNICLEADNSLRNASHHGGFVFDELSQVIRFRAGKGGQGEEETLSYTMYLKRCCDIFMQAMVIFRIELIFSKNAGARTPL